MSPLSITGLMARRLLVNWRVPAPIAADVLPPRVRPKLVRGWAIAGLCLVRLEHMRAVGLPAWTGLASENLAVRMGIEWDTPAGTQRSVLIFRRETASRINALVGDRIGYGIHHRGAFDVLDDGPNVRISVHSADGHTHHAAIDDRTPQNALGVFSTANEADTFFRGGENGYSLGRTGRWEGLRLHLHRWDLRPARIVEARSSLIDQLFGPHAQVDSAFLMRNIEHTWTPCGTESFGAVRHARARLQAA